MKFRSIRIPSIVQAATACLVLLTSARAEPPMTSREAFAAYIEGMLAEMKETDYQAQTEIDEETGSLKCDCSGLICYVLRHQFPEAYVSVRGMEAQWRKRPFSVTFYETFMAASEEAPNNSPWQRIRRITDARPGDVLAWRTRSIEEGVSTGHTCMIASVPEEEPDGRIRVRVIDSTRKTHANDTRPGGKLGVGAGDMWFTVNDDDEPEGFYVNDQSRHSTSNKIAIGRIINLGEQPHDEHLVPSDADFVGLKTSAAIDLAMERKTDWRVIDDDGKITPVKLGLTDSRVNFVVRKGKVVRTLRG